MSHRHVRVRAKFAFLLFCRSCCWILYCTYYLKRISIVIKYLLLDFGIRTDIKKKTKLEFVARIANYWVKNSRSVDRQGFSADSVVVCQFNAENQPSLLVFRVGTSLSPHYLQNLIAAALFCYMTCFKWFGLWNVSSKTKEIGCQKRSGHQSIWRHHYTM